MSYGSPKYQVFLEGTNLDSFPIEVDKETATSNEIDKITNFLKDEYSITDVDVEVSKYREAEMYAGLTNGVRYDLNKFDYKIRGSFFILFVKEFYDSVKWSEMTRPCYVFRTSVPPFADCTDSYELWKDINETVIQIGLKMNINKRPEIQNIYEHPVLYNIYDKFGIESFKEFMDGIQIFAEMFPLYYNSLSIITEIERPLQ